MTTNAPGQTVIAPYHVELIHLVLDGVATPAQKNELDGLMANNDAVRNEFEATKKLFAALAQLPEVQPPSVLVSEILVRTSAVIAKRGGVSNPSGNWLRQRWRKLFGPSTVVRSYPTGSRRAVTAPSSNRHQVSRPLSKQEFRMSTEKKGFVSSPKGKVAIGAGAVAAIVIAVSIGTDFPKSGTDTSGTIAPAQRYRAPQNTAADINVVAPGGSAAQTSGTSVGNVSGDAAGAAAGNAAGAAAGNAAGRAAGAAAATDAAGRAAGNAAGAAAGNAAGAAAGNAAGAAAGNAAGAAAGNAAGAAAGNAAGAAAGNAAGRAAGNAAGAAAGNAAGAAAGNAAGRAAGNAAGAAAGAAAGNAAGRAAGNAAGAAAGNAAGAAAANAAGRQQ